MKTIVLYSTIGGNTEKVAGEVASELGCQCTRISKDFDSSTLPLNDYDLVFIGTGVYGGRPNTSMLDYLKKVDLENSRKFALFATWFGRANSGNGALDKLEEILETKGQNVLESRCKCLGEGRSAVFRGVARLMRHDTRGHPNAEELAAARKWAKELTII